MKNLDQNLLPDPNNSYNNNNLNYWIMYNVSLNSCVIGACFPNWLSVLMKSVTRVNSLQNAIASGSGLENPPCWGQGVFYLPLRPLRGCPRGEISHSFWRGVVTDCSGFAACTECRMRRDAVTWYKYGRI